MPVREYGYALLKRCGCKVQKTVHRLQSSSLLQLSTACKLEVNCDKDVSRERYVPSGRATRPSLTQPADCTFLSSEYCMVSCYEIKL